MKLRHYVLFLVLLSIAILTVAIPVAADLKTVPQNGIVLIGEKDLDISNAVDTAPYIAWWAGDPNSTPSGPTRSIDLSGYDVDHFNIDSTNFAGTTSGWWWQWDGTNAPTEHAFQVLEPVGHVKIWDNTASSDVTDGTAMIGNELDFVIDPTNLQYIYLRDLNVTPRDVKIVVTNPGGVKYTALWTIQETQKPLTNLRLNISPWHWSSGDSSNIYVPDLWATGTLDASNYPIYSAGDYIVTLQCNENGLGFTSTARTVTLEEEQPEITVTPSSLIRGEKFYTTVKGIPNWRYIIWIKDCVACPNGCCSDQMTGDCCDRPPLMMDNQTGVLFYDKFGYFYAPCSGQQEVRYTINNTLIEWCGCMCTKNLSGIMPKDPSYSKYTYAIVETDENGERTIEWQTSTCTKPSSYKIHVQRWEYNDVCALDTDRPYDEACVNIEQGVVTINTEVCDEMTDSTYLGETVRVFGTNTDSKVTYLFIKGPCQSCVGDNMTVTHSVINGVPLSFTQVNVIKSDDTWEYFWYTRDLQIDLGQYTIYATSMPNDAPTLEGVPCTECVEGNESCAAWAKKPFTFLEPTLTADVNPKIIQIICCAGPSIIVDGEAMGLRGEAVGEQDNTVPIGIWVFGENKVAGQKYIFEIVKVDCPTGEFSADLSNYFSTLDLSPGTYTVVVQHPMYNHRLDIIPENKISDEWNWYWWWGSYVHNEVWYPDINRKFVVTATPVRWSKLFVIDGPDRLAGTAALNALLAGFDDPNIDDNIAVLTFKVESNNALQAGFSGTPTSGGSPLSVQFTDISIGSPTTWSWDFGDGFTSTEPNPLHVYQNAGTYSVTLSVTGLSGSSSVTKNGYISVTTGPTQTGTVTPTPTQAPHTINLYTGWNLISTPRTLAIGQNTTGVVFAGVLDKTGGRPLWLYDASSGWISMDSGTIVKPLDGIWIYQTSPSTVTLTYKNDPTELPPTKNLYSGWNLIGFSDVSPVSAKGTLISVKNQWSIAMGFNAVTQQYETPAIINDVNDGTLMNPMKGYWLFMNAPGTLAAISA
jgi:PKD repeat protein